MSTSWADVLAGWPASMVALQHKAVATFSASILAAPERYVPVVQRFVAELQVARAHLLRLRVLASHLDDPQLTAGVDALSRRWQDLAAGFYAHARPATSSMGAVPVALVVGGVVVGVVAIAWAAGAYQYAVSLREQTALADRELSARLEASHQGRPLQPSTLPPAAPSPAQHLTEAAKGLTWVVLGGGLVAVAAVLSLPKLLRR